MSEPGEKKRSVHDFTLKTIDGKDQSLENYRGKVLLLVNVASKCGLTPQYKGLQALYDKYRDKGLSVLGFPSNDFAGQEPGTEAEIQNFCSTRYEVTFPLFSKITVKGGGKHPLYQYLTEDSPTPGEIEWNFGKFLVGKDGQVIGRFRPQTEPLSAEIVTAVERAIAG